MKQQKQSLAVPNSYNVKPAKPFISDKYNNNIELKKLKRVNYFTTALLELRSWGFSENEGISCTNIKTTVEKLTVWHKALPTYRESGDVYIEFNTLQPYMVGKQENGDIGAQGGLTNGVAKVKWIKILRKFQTKNCQNNAVHTST